MHYITAENARELAERAKAAKAANAERARQRIAAAENVLAQLNPEQVTKVANAYADPDAYSTVRLARVRGQLASLDKRIESMILEGSDENAAALARLCDSQAKLAEQERILAGRPLPGSHRPRQSSGPRRPSAADPLAE